MSKKEIFWGCIKILLVYAIILLIITFVFPKTAGPYKNDDKDFYSIFYNSCTCW